MADELVRCKVIGPFEIAGVGRGGTVDLDPARINIGALVAAGHVEVPKTAKKAADPA